jgi:hypothetical protein
MIVMKKGDHALFAAWYLALIVVCTISFTVWIRMYQAANIDKAKEMLMSSFKDTVQMDADTTFITNLPLLDDKTTTITMVDEPDMSIFGCLYSYLQSLPRNWSLIVGALTSDYIACNGVHTLFHANSLTQTATSVTCPKTKFHKKSSALLIMLAVLSVEFIATGTGVQALQQVSLHLFLAITHY